MAGVFPAALSPRTVGIIHRHSAPPPSLLCRAAAKTPPPPAAEYAAIGGGLVSIPVVAWSLYTLKTTGCGLPPGPGGSIGAIEGVSYLGIAAIVAWSVWTKAKTGSGLPPGAFGLLGAVEGFAYLTVAAIAIVFGLQFFDHGFIPGPLPSAQCFA